MICIETTNGVIEMRLSELKRVLGELEVLAQKKCNFDPVIELFYQSGETEEFNIDLVAIKNDPEGQLTSKGSIHLPLKEIVKRGYIIMYGTDRGEDCITIHASCESEAERIFLDYFSTYQLKTITQES